MATPANVEPVYLDAWELRCIFNSSLLLARVAAGELIVSPRNKGNNSPRSQDPPGSKGQYFTYRDRDDNEVATVHFFHLNGMPLSPPDPKSIWVERKRYLVHTEDLIANPEKKLFRTIKWRKRYGCYRNLKCCLQGPLVAVPLWH